MTIRRCAILGMVKMYAKYGWLYDPVILLFFLIVAAAVFFLYISVYLGMSLLCCIL